MAARKQSPWMKRFLKLMADEFDGDKCYSCHSTILGRRLAIDYPTQIRVLNYTSFYHPGWEEDATRLLYEPSKYRPGENITAGYFLGMHLFESHKNFQGYIRQIDENWLKNTDTHFGALMRPFLEMDEKAERKKKKNKK